MAATSSKDTSLLTDELRAKTKGLHTKMDRIVQLGLFTVLDYQIYRQILLSFYYVFRTFEEEYERHLKSADVHPWTQHAYSPELRRTEAFEADLAYFYGSDWKQHVCPSKQVEEYMAHIRDISKHHPEKLVAFPATLYLGIFFGGQIARSKIVKKTNFFPNPPDKKLGGENDNGIAIFTFREQTNLKSPAAAASVSSSADNIGNDSEDNEGNMSLQGKKLDPNKVRIILKERLNTIPGIDDKSGKAVAEREAIADEAREIFARNLDLFTAVEGVSKVWTRWIVTSLLYLAIAVGLYQILVNRSSFDRSDAI